MPAFSESSHTHRPKAAVRHADPRRARDLEHRITHPSAVLPACPDSAVAAYALAGARQPGSHPRQRARPRPSGGRLEIARAVPAGSRRARDQREWLRAATGLIDAAGWYACRSAHYAEIARVYGRYMDWTARTTRPGHERVAQLAGTSVRTVRRCVRWLHEQGLMGTVSPGTTPLLRPGILHGLADAAERNDAAVYVLAVPRRKRLTTSALMSSGEFGRLSVLRRRTVKAPRAGSVQAGKVKGQKARPAAGPPCVPRSGAEFPIGRNPETHSEGLAAAAAMRDRSRLLARLSREHLRWLAKRFFAAGWTPGDVMHALDYDPGGRQHGYSADVRHVAGWVRYRLSLWTDPQGVPVASRSQRVAAGRERVRAQQSAARAERQRRSEAAASVDVPRRVAELRAIVSGRRRH